MSLLRSLNPLKCCLECKNQDNSIKIKVKSSCLSTKKKVFIINDKEHIEAIIEFIKTLQPIEQ